MNTLIAQKQKALYAAQDSLVYWLMKTPEFWANWNGKNRTVILTNWVRLVLKYQAELNALQQKDNQDG